MTEKRVSHLVPKVDLEISKTHFKYSVRCAMLDPHKSRAVV